MKKVISLALIISILFSNFSALAYGDCNECSDSGSCKSVTCGSSSCGQNGFVQENKGIASGEKDQSLNSGQFARVVKAVIATGIVLGTFAGVKILSTVMGASGSKVTKFAGRTIVGLAGTCAAIASIINSGTNLSEVSKAAYYGDTGKVNKFCFGLNAVNVIASLYTLKYIVSGQIFSGNSIKVSVYI